MDVDSIVTQGINSTDIMSTVNTTVQQVLSNTGINMDAVDMTGGYLPSILCIATIALISAKAVNTVFNALLRLAFVAVLLYFICFKTHAALEILPMMDKYAPDFLRFLKEFTVF